MRTFFLLFIHEGISSVICGITFISFLWSSVEDRKGKESYSWSNRWQKIPWMKRIWKVRNSSWASAWGWSSFPSRALICASARARKWRKRWAQEASLVSSSLGTCFSSWYQSRACADEEYDKWWQLSRLHFSFKCWLIIRWQPSAGQHTYERKNEMKAVEADWRAKRKK